MRPPVLRHAPFPLGVASKALNRDTASPADPLACDGGSDPAPPPETLDAQTQAQINSGYDWNGSSWVHDDAINPGDDGAEGGLRMSARDLAKDAALSTNSILSNQSRAQLRAQAKLNDDSAVPYGLGWVLDSVDHQAFNWHNGQISGFHSMFARFPDKGWSVIVLTNRTDGVPEGIALGVAGLIDSHLK